MDGEHQFPGLGIQALHLHPHRVTPFLPGNSAESYDSNVVFTQQRYRLLSWKVQRKQAFLTWLCCLQPQRPAGPKTQVPQHNMEWTLLRNFFSFCVVSSCSLTIFHRDNISHWTGNLSLKIPSDMSCLGKRPCAWSLASYTLQLMKWRLYDIFLRGTVCWHNWLVQYML